CNVSPALTATQGASISTETVTCSSVSQSAVIYFGIRNDQFVIGDKEAGSGAPVAGTDQFKTPAQGAGPCPGANCTITYSGTSTLPINSPTSGNTAINTRLVLTLTSGSGSIVAVTNAAPHANTNNGDIGMMFQVTGSSFAVTVQVWAAFPNAACIA